MHTYFKTNRTSCTNSWAGGGAGVSGSVTVTHVVRGDVLQRRDADVARVSDELFLEDLDDAVHAVGAVHVAEHEGAADADALGAKREELEDVTAVADTAVRPDVDLVDELGGLLVDLEQDLERRGGAVERAAAVVRDDDGGHLVLRGFADRLHRLDALERERELGQGAQLLVVVPGEQLRLVGEERLGADAVAVRALAVAARVRVDGPDERLGAGLLDAAD